MAKAASRPSEFGGSISDCCDEFAKYADSRLSLELVARSDSRGRPVLSWIAVLHLPSRGVLQPREYRDGCLAIHKGCSDPLASAYGLLINLLRKVEACPQSKFWLGDR